MSLSRIIMHWSAGSHTPSSLDRKHYHFIVAGDGTVVDGDLQPEANLSTKTQYAAHTRGTNTGSIGVAMAAMAGAHERPFDAGSHPITDDQLEAFVRMVADLCEAYNIPVTRETVLTHAEVQTTLGIKQRGKWDINWLPGMSKPNKPSVTGDLLRSMIKEVMRDDEVVPVAPPAVEISEDRSHPMQSTTIQSSLKWMAVTAGPTGYSMYTAFQEQDDVTRWIIVGVVGVIALYSLHLGRYIITERLEKWHAGHR